MPAPDFRTEVEPHHILKFGSDFEHVYQENGPKLKDFVTVKPEEGEGATAVHLFGQATAVEDDTPYRENPVSAVQRNRVWYAPEPDIEWGEEIETRDLLLQARNPASDLMKSGTMAIGRRIDAKIIAAALGTRKLGKTFAGTANDPLPATQKLLISAGSDDGTTATGMNLAKLRKAFALFGKNNVDLDRERPCLAMTWEQHENLSEFTELTSADFFRTGEEPYYVGGMLRGAMGFTFVMYNALPKTGTTRTNVAWLKSAVQYGEWSPLKADMWGLPAKRNIPYCYAHTIMAATRKQNEGVIEIPCAEAA